MQSSPECESNQIEGRYKTVRLLAQGQQGQIYLAKDIETNQMVAMKQILVYDDIVQGMTSSNMREVSIMRRLSQDTSQYVVQIYDQLVQENMQLIIVMEVIEQNLTELLQKKTLSSAEVRRHVRQLLQALLLLSQHSVLHRDIKPDNILVRKVRNEEQLVLADFGLARFVSYLPQDMTQEVQTLFYRAPEVFVRIEKYSFAIDMWSLGCIFAEIV